MSCSSSSSLGTVSCPINSNTFPGKLWKLVNGGRFQSIGWSNGGTCIAINGTTFKNEVLYNDEFSVFKTQNFSSFVRQLNLYGFRKLAAVSSKDSMSGEDIHHFQNPCFNRNRPEMLGHVRRASSRRRGGSENAENSYFTTTPYRFGSFAPGSSSGYQQTLFHHQGITYAPVKLGASHSEPLREIKNRFNPYRRTFGTGQQCHSHGWGPVAGGGSLQGLTLIASTGSGSLMATCPSESRPVDYPSLYNQQGQLRKFVVIQEDIGHGLQSSTGSISLSRSDEPLLSNSCDPMMCAAPQPSPPQQVAPHTFILSPPPAFQSQRAYHYPTPGPGCSPPTPPLLPSRHDAGLQPAAKSLPKVYAELSPATSTKTQTLQFSSNQVSSKGNPVATSPTHVS